MSHEGWKNYETFVMADHFNNDEWRYMFVRNLANGVRLDPDNGRLELADQLKAWQEDLTPDLGALWSDLLGAAFSEVDWIEIADSLLTDIAEVEP